ncbi:uncharacterized protein ndufv3 isoform X3 [Syngnathus scovelli]|uniref:uncharacterized protein ndufv3 isoform X3 n=1 Tax=Syngnathus scovelli TaxID=161590 RepID=UPI00211095F1|nr:uncharacterized protein ndufv3 isoform X3 [Syngnathus scovelli]
MSIAILLLRQRWTSKCYLLKSWGTLRTCMSALCTTQTGEAVKSTAKAANEPDERATLQRHKTGVSFPIKVLNHEAFPIQPLGMSISMPISTVDSVVNAFPAIDNIEITPIKKEALSDSTPPLGTDVIITHGVFPVVDDNFSPAPGQVATTKTPNSELGDQASTKTPSSLSNDTSDSDSDSEDDEHEISEQDVSEVPQNTQVKFQHMTSHEKGHSNDQNDEILPELEANNAPAPLPAEAAHTEASKNTREVQHFSVDEERINSAPRFQDVSEDVSDINETDLEGELCSFKLIACPGSLTVPLSVENSAVKSVIEVSSPGQDLEITEHVCPEVNTAPMLVEDESAHQGTVKPPCGTAAFQVDGAVPSGTTSDIPTMVFTTSQSTSEQLHTMRGEHQTQTPREEPAKMVPKPEDASDNSKYQNYQHHSYTPYTFADMDLEMAKYRLPQPTSGRPSPRH